MQDLLCCVERVQNDLLQVKNKHQDQKKLVELYRKDVENIESELKEKSDKEVCSVTESTHQYKYVIDHMITGKDEICISPC